MLRQASVNLNNFSLVRSSTRVRYRLMWLAIAALVVAFTLRIPATFGRSPHLAAASVPREWLQRRHLTRLHNSSCRTTRIGPEYVCDEAGVVCSLSQLSRHGCCQDDDSFARFDCHDCGVIHCCASYHTCVSCCLKPEHIMLREQVFANITRLQQQAMSHVKDSFEYCLVKCRTNSMSVKHENKFRNDSLRHCYGPALPSIQNDGLKR
eukprot:m.187585 g.187585  ORF g.187585 m.187585 type:complete len:208 (-) comp16930_c0_seq4:4207-4830(-)